MDDPTTAAGKWPGWREPGPGAFLAALAIALAFVALTRAPVARPEAFDFDEVGYLETIELHRIPMHHTLFLASGRVLGAAVGDPYRGFVLLDMLVSTLAMTAAWWWLRALVAPATAAAATLVLGVAPAFWAYGAMAANYTAIPLVGCGLLGLAWRGHRAESRRPWHPYAAAIVLAAGTGYRQDLGTFWLPVFFVILWQHRWVPAAGAVTLFTGLNLAWLAPMLREAGGWDAYRAASAEFAHQAGYLNSVWHLGWVDAPARYALKALMALAWTFGPGLVFAPRGLVRSIRSGGEGRVLAGLLALSVGPALLSHLLVHFGVPGYAFHYVPALLALLALGIGRAIEAGPDLDPDPARSRSAAPRLAGLAALLAGVFLFYPTDYDRPGIRGSFDLAFARQTRAGLRTPPPLRDPAIWRTVNSQELPGGRRAREARTSLLQIMKP